MSFTNRFYQFASHSYKNDHFSEAIPLLYQSTCFYALWMKRQTDLSESISPDDVSGICKRVELYCVCLKNTGEFTVSEPWKARIFLGEFP
jgi:hypothetical protein